ncbi:GNAT family N-acetyltransferase [Haloarculaceae archaeon H-GB1-1]|nr:GNAT family N-acetyltransferase [Haloarculaceae archaeon H-GB1-1]
MSSITDQNTNVSITNRGIEVTAADADQRERWNGFVDRSAQGSAFHYDEFLDVVADHLDATVHRLVGFKGQEPVGIFPVFELRKGISTAVFSPPPDMGLSQMGPAMLNVDKLKRRKAEKRRRRFIGGALDWIEDVVDPSYVHVRTHYRHQDHRPFVWNDFDLSPRYTYVLDLTPGKDEIMTEFSSDARRNVRNTDDDAFEIEERGIDAVADIVDHLRRRHEEQGISYPVTADFVSDLYRNLPDGTVRTYVCTVDGSYASGMITLEDETSVYRWQGGARPMGDVTLPVNDLVDWRVISDAIDRGKERYDLIGANTPQLCEYKSKFGPELESYQAAERGTRTMRMVSRLYQRLR